MTNIKITPYGKTLIKKIVAELTDVFISSLVSNNHLMKKEVEKLILEVMEKEEIPFMRYISPAIKKIFINISKVAELETSNSWTYKLKNKI